MQLYAPPPTTLFPPSYFGNKKSMLIPNTIFRVGGAAMLLTNKRSETRRAKYRLQHVLRTNLASNDAAYNCVYETEDEEGHRGVRLSKDLMAIAGGRRGGGGALTAG
jgi:3-ketoacyl-CoA synthase